jgi:cytoplasmic iron level regulating protein YaaA (DUF328/UPF0246 family)
MLAVVSPAKSLNFDLDLKSAELSEPRFLSDTAELAAVAAKLTRDDIRKMMGISEKLADLNYERFQHFVANETPETAREAIFAFRGDTYIGFDADTADEACLEFARGHVRILSGLYGLLRPMDRIQPYRLEMGKKIKTERGKNLYEFWGTRIAEAINDDTAGHKNRSLINLASNEYFSAVKTNLLAGPVITPQFKEIKNDVMKMIGFNAKRARGMMARYIADNRLEDPNDLKSFTIAGYEYRDDLSNDKEWVFTREAMAVAA